METSHTNVCYVTKVSRSPALFTSINDAYIQNVLKQNKNFKFECAVSGRGITKFSNFIYHSKFTVETNHTNLACVTRYLVVLSNWKFTLETTVVDIHTDVVCD